MTGRSRGFAFIVFKDLSGIEAALAQTAHVVKGKKVTCKKVEARQGKVYVGKLPPGDSLSKEDLQAHFEQFGSVVEVVRPVDKMKNNEPKTFAFITFAREDAAKQLVKQGQSTINDTHTVEIKKVTPKEQMGGGGWGGQGYGGQGGGWGYNDPYGYGGYGGGYGDPYGGYGGYGAGCWVWRRSWRQDAWQSQGRSKGPRQGWWPPVLTSSSTSQSCTNAVRCHAQVLPWHASRHSLWHIMWPIWFKMLWTGRNLLVISKCGNCLYHFAAQSRFMPTITTEF